MGRDMYWDVDVGMSVRPYAGIDVCIRMWYMYILIKIIYSLAYAFRRVCRHGSGNMRTRSVWVNVCACVYAYLYNY